jgi:hypothetical protein
MVSNGSLKVKDSRAYFASVILSFNKWYSRVYSLCIFIVFRAKELPQEKFFIPVLGEGITRKKLVLLLSRRCSNSMGVEK